VRILTWLVVPPALVVAIGFAIANRGPATISADPFQPGSAAWSVSLPLYVIVFAAVLAGIVLGGLASVFARARSGRRARDARIKADILSRELAARDRARAASPPVQTSLPAIRA
jgi:uncharacterized integral membrane protein